MGENLISNVVSNPVSRHTLFTTTIEASFDSPGSSNRGVSWDGTNAICLSLGDVLVYLQAAFTSTPTNSFDFPGFGSGSGVGWDGTNALMSDRTHDVHYQFTGFTSTQLDSFDSLTVPYGADWDDTNFLACDSAADDIIKYTAFTSTVLASFAVPAGPQGNTFDGTDYYTTDNATRVYQFDGFTTTPETSIAVVASGSYGLAWESRFAPAAGGGAPGLMRVQRNRIYNRILTM